MTNEDLCKLALAAIDDAPRRACWLCGDAEDGPQDPCSDGSRHEYRDVPRNTSAENAQVVLLDAVLECGWWDERLATVRWWPSSHSGEQKWRTRSRWLRTMSPDPDRISSRARAIAAVLLFGEWPMRWELAERCRRDETLDEWWLAMNESTRRNLHD